MLYILSFRLVYLLTLNNITRRYNKQGDAYTIRVDLPLYKDKG